jgi:hypothetical protein
LPSQPYGIMRKSLRTALSRHASLHFCIKSFQHVINQLWQRNSSHSQLKIIPLSLSLSRLTKWNPCLRNRLGEDYSFQQDKHSVRAVGLEEIIKLDRYLLGHAQLVRAQTVRGRSGVASMATWCPVTS